MFNLEQLEELEKVFAKQHNLVGKKRAQLAAQLNLTENQVRAGTPGGTGCSWGQTLLSHRAWVGAGRNLWAFFSVPDHWGDLTIGTLPFLYDEKVLLEVTLWKQHTALN